MVRNARSKAARRNFWTQIGVSACVLLLPPMALGAAVYSMLPARDGGAVRHVVGTVAQAHAAATVFPAAAAETWPASVEAQPAEAPKPLAVPAKPAPATARGAFSLASARQEPVGKQDQTAKTAAKDAGAGKESGKDAGRMLGPVPVRVTVVVPPPAVAPPPSAETDNAPTGSINAEEPVHAAAAEVPAALLSPVQAPPVQVPAARVPAAEVPAAELPFTEAPPESATASSRKHGRLYYLRSLAWRNGARAEARSEARAEARAARLNAQSSQHAFSLRNWLQNLNTRPRNTRG